MILLPVYWHIILSIIQIFSHGLVIVLLFQLYNKIGISIYSSFLLSLIIGFNPNLLYYSTYILSDQIFGVIVSLTWISLIALVFSKSKQKIISNKYLYITGIFSGLAIVTKPAWLLGILPIILTVLLIERNKRILFISISVLLVLHFSFSTYWTLYKNQVNNKPIYGISKEENVIERLLLYFGGRNINDGAIRLGLINHGIGTDLYNKIESKGLLNTAKKLNGDNMNNYLIIKDSLNWEDWSDVEFARSILTNVPGKYYFNRMKQWYTFFTKRMFHPSIDSAFPKASYILKLGYIKFYNVLYRPFLLLLLLIFIGMMIIIKNIRYKIILYSSIPIICYYTILHTLIASWNNEFIRFRTSIEYILFFCALLPIGIIFDKIIDYFHQSYVSKVKK